MDYFTKIKEENKSKLSVPGLVAELLDAATKVHFLHLSVTGAGSYAQHKALNELYDALPGLADTIAEGWTGVTGQIPTYKAIQAPMLESVEECIKYIDNLHNRITNLQKTIEYSEIVNDLDTIKSQLNSSKYKLKFLA